MLPSCPTSVSACWLSPRRGQAGRLFAAVLAGAVAGTLVLAALAATSPGRRERAMLLALPGIDGADARGRRRPAGT